jgi:peptidoglycan hydrolase-like protein with peptidoglycan-binding domain
MTPTGRLSALAFAATLALGNAHAAEDPLTRPGSALYQPSPDIRAQVRDVMSDGGARTVQPPAATTTTLPDLEPGNPVPRGLVAVAQRELAGQGYDAGPVDGRLGPKTRQAIKAFQADKGLPQDGQLTFDLLAKLMVRAAPVVQSPAPPPPPAPLPVVSWNFRAVLGKNVHALPGDLLGQVADFVIGPDDKVEALVIATTNGYGTHQGKALVPFAQIGHAITRAAVILPLSADKALPLRDRKQNVELAPGQWLLSSRLENGADATADTDGKLSPLK